MQGQSNPGQKDFPESEKGFEQGKGRQGQGPGTGSQQDRGAQQNRGSTGTGTATGTAPQDPRTEQQDPGTSQQDSTFRNPSGDDLSEGIEGDEGSGRGVL